MSHPPSKTCASCGRRIEWRKKWDGQWRYDVTDGAFAQDGHEALVFAVRPAKALAFGKQPFSHTRHRF